MGAPKKMAAPILINLLMNANDVVRLDRQAHALTKKHGFKVYRSDIMREVLSNYLDTNGV